MPGLDDMQEYISGLHSRYLEYPLLEGIRAQVDRLLVRDNKSSEGAAMALVGASRSGKTKFIEEYESRFPVEKRAIVTASGWSDRKRVVSIRMPDSSAKNILEKVHEGITGVKPADARRFDHQRDLPALAEAAQTKLLIIDEAHQVVNDKGVVPQKTAIVLKDLLNMGIFSILFVGLPETLFLFKANTELRNRRLQTFRLKTFDWDVSGDRDNLLDILADYDDYMERVFGRKSGFTDAALALRLHVASDGLVGVVAKLVENAASFAAQEMFAGKADRVTMRHFAMAFDGDDDNDDRPNPFRATEQPIVKVPMAEAMPPYEPLRRGLSEALFDKR